jgi:HSP20 family protein
MKLENLKENVDSLWDNITEGWNHLRTATASALTRFKPGEETNLPAAAEIDDAFFRPARSWAMLGGDVFEDDDRLIVRVELPGLSKDEIDIEVGSEGLVISGEKRFQRETSPGRWRVMQCAYGSFRRVVALPVAVKADAAGASYKSGVLRVELPKAQPGQRKGVSIKIE